MSAEDKVIDADRLFRDLDALRGQVISLQNRVSKLEMALLSVRGKAQLVECRHERAKHGTTYKQLVRELGGFSYPIKATVENSWKMRKLDKTPGSSA